ncbi:MAG: alpha/beta fold hydrolase [Acidimicrobiales bacterium]
MATFVLLPGAGSDSWYWHLVAPILQAAGHAVVAVDLPVDDPESGLDDYAQAAIEAIGDATGLVVVAQSMGAYTAGLVAHRRPVDLVVLVAAMTPAPRESPGDWWENTGQPEAARAQAMREGRDPDAEFDPFEVFLHDVAPDIAAASADHVRVQSETPFAQPWPMDRWPAVSTRFLLGRHDRLLPADFQRRVVLERLGIVPDEIDTGHLPALSRPAELAARLLAYAAEVGL